MHSIDVLQAFLLTLSVVWILLFALNFSAVQVIGPEDVYPRPGAPPDPIKCLIYATIAAFVVFIIAVIFWLIGPRECGEAAVFVV